MLARVAAEPHNDLDNESANPRRKTNASSELSQLKSFNSRIASPAPLRLASRISEYLRDRITSGAPARRAARTASLTLCDVHLLLLGSVGMSISMPGQIRVLVPATPASRGSHGGQPWEVFFLSIWLLPTNAGRRTRS